MVCELALKGTLTRTQQFSDIAGQKRTIAEVRLEYFPDGADQPQTDPDKGWVVLLRLCSPLPSFFDKSWQPSEIEPVD